jgi:hypothetical protein
MKSSLVKPEFLAHRVGLALRWCAAKGCGLEKLQAVIEQSLVADCRP